MEMKEFAILHWTEEELIKYEDVSTTYNPSNSLSKPTGQIKFHEHFDVLMGCKKPNYVTHIPIANTPTMVTLNITHHQ